MIKDVLISNLDRFNPVSLLSKLGKKYKRASTSYNAEGKFCPGRKKKRRTTMRYDHNRAYKCVIHDWLGDIPWFNDKHSFQLKRALVEFTINDVAKHNSFWTKFIDSANRLSCFPHVKFLTAMKLICYGVSFSAFQDYFQNGESSARLCVSNCAKFIVECTQIAEIYLHTPTRDDAKCIVALHKEKHGIC